MAFNGLWRVPATTIRPGFGMLVWNCLAAFIVTTAVVFSTIGMVKLGDKAWPQTKVLRLGLIFLSVYLNLRWIDTVVHQVGGTVPYGYIFASSTFSVFKIVSDVFVFWGMWQFVFRLEHLDVRFERPKGPTLQSGKLYELPRYSFTSMMAILLLFFSAYHICLLFGLTIAWLQATDPQIIQLIATARNGFEVAYMAVQFVGTLAMGGWFETGYELGNFNYYGDYKESAIAAIIALGARSFCEIVIVGQLDRSPDNLAEIMRARDVTYSLFSMPLAVALVSGMPNFLEHPAVVKEENEAEEVRRLVLQKIDHGSQNGLATAPEIKGILDEIEGQLNSGEALNGGVFQAISEVPGKARQSIEAQLLEVERIRTLYGQWTPIRKS